MMECPRCEGRGVCVDCQGSGLLPCPACDGAGSRSTPRGTTYQCKSCAGSGQVECPKTCASCEGTGEITDELQQAMREKYTPRFANMTPLSRVTGVLLAINLTIFVAAWVPEGADFILTYLVNDDAYVARHQYWRFFTPMFVHFAIWHVAFNMGFLYRYGPELEGVYGSGLFTLIYLASGVGGSVVSWLGGANGIGASGALFGVGAAFLALHKRFGLFGSEEMRGWGIYLLGYLAYGFAMQLLDLNILNIDNWAHLGGFVTGAALVYLLPRPQGR